VTRRQPGQLIPPTRKQRIGPDDDGVGTLLDQARESRLDIAFAVGM
jgi:hypothetical protein